MTIHSPENKTYTDQTTINIDVTGSDNHAGISNWYYDRDAGGEQGFTPNTSLTYTEGQHNLTVKAEDGNNNNGTKTVYFFVDLTLKDGYVSSIASGKSVSLRSSPTTDMSNPGNMQEGVQDLVFGNSLGKNLSGQLRINLSAGNVTADQLVVDTNRTTKKSVLYNTSTVSNIKEKTLLIPREDDTGKVHICPTAESLSETKLDCGSDGYNVSSGNTVNGVTLSEVTINGQDYYEATGVNGTGGVEVASSSSDDGGGGSSGGGSGGGSSEGSTGGVGGTTQEGTTVFFNQPVYSVTPGSTVTKTFEVNNNLSESDTVEVLVPQQSPQCQVFEVEESLNSGRFDFSGKYDVSSAFDNGEAFTTTASVRISMPKKQKLDAITNGTGKVSCELETDAENGEAGELVLTAESGGIAAQIQNAFSVDLPTFTLFSDVCLNTKNTSAGETECSNSFDLNFGPVPQILTGMALGVVFMVLFGRKILGIVGGILGRVV